MNLEKINNIIWNRENEEVSFFYYKSCTCTLNDQRYLLNGALQELYYAGNAYIFGKADYVVSK